MTLSQCKDYEEFMHWNILNTNLKFNFSIFKQNTENNLLLILFNNIFFLNNILLLELHYCWISVSAGPDIFRTLPIQKKCRGESRGEGGIFTKPESRNTRSANTLSQATQNLKIIFIFLHLLHLETRKCRLLQQSETYISSCQYYKCRTEQRVEQVWFLL